MYNQCSERYELIEGANQKKGVKYPYISTLNVSLQTNGSSNINNDTQQKTIVMYYVIFHEFIIYGYTKDSFIHKKYVFF